MTKDMKPVKSRTRTGQFPEGTSGNPKGRMPGTRNTKTLQWEHLGEYITGPHAAQFNDLLNELWASHCINDRMKAAELFLKTVDYFKPRLQRVDAMVSEVRDLPRPIIILHSEDEDPAG